jgi:hypothetical protein
MTRTVLSFDKLNKLNSDRFDPFTQTDRLIEKCTRSMTRRFARLASKASSEDDANVIMTMVWQTYADAWQDYEDCLAGAYKAAYGLVLSGADKLQAQAAFESYVASYALPEGFIPKSEWERKRARCLEALAADANAGVSKKKSVETSRNVTVRQARQGADDMTILGLHDAYRAAGVDRVRFVTQRDGRVCAECMALDGNVYELGKQPSIPIHHNCRCFYIPVI